MPKFRKRHKPPVDIDGQDSLKPTSSPTHKPFRHKRRKTSAAPYQHFAGAIRQPEISHHLDDFPEADPTTLLVVKGFVAVTLLICFGMSPDLTLRLLVLAETILFAFPPFFTRWPVLIAILFPLRTKSLLEIVIGLAVFSWISKLDWVYACERIVHWVSRGQKKEGEEFNTQV